VEDEPERVPPLQLAHVQVSSSTSGVLTRGKPSPLQSLQLAQVQLSSSTSGVLMQGKPSPLQQEALERGTSPQLHFCWIRSSYLDTLQRVPRGVGPYLFGLPAPRTRRGRRPPAALSSPVKHPRRVGFRTRFAIVVIRHTAARSLPAGHRSSRCRNSICHDAGLGCQVVA
jgi:hypothetical protein